MTLLSILLIVAIVAILALLAFGPTMARRIQRGGLVAAVNYTVGTHGYNLTRKANAAWTVDYLLVKPTANAGEVALCGAADMPLGICTDQPRAAGDQVNVDLLGIIPETRMVIASEAIGLDDEIYTAADGKVQDLPVAAGTYWKIGRPLTAASGDGKPLEIVPCYPVKVVVS